MVTIRVGLYSDNIAVGWVVFKSLVIGENNSFCLPNDILAPQEVEQIRRTLCRLPQVNEGQTGKYQWKASNKPLPAAAPIPHRNSRSGRRSVTL